MQLIWADQGDAGALRQWTKAHTGITRQVVYPWWRQLKRYLPELLDELGYQPGFNVIPRRWVVERLPIRSGALIYVTCIRLLLARLA